MKIFSMYQFILISTLFSLFTSKASGISSITNVVRGAFVTEISTKTYETTIPVSFILDLPDVAEIVPTVLNHSVNCEEKNQGAVAVCQLLVKAKQINKILLEDVVTAHPYIRRGPLKKALLPFIGDAYKYLFGTSTTQDTDDLHVDQEFLEKRGRELKEAVHSNHEALVQVTGNLTAYNNKLKDIFSRQFLELDKEQQSSKNMDLTLALASSYILHNQHIEHLLLTLDSAASECRNRMIPRGLLVTEVLHNRLTKLDANLKKHDYELAVNTTSIYKAPLCNCWFTKGQIHLTIQVPVRKKSETYQLFQIYKLPFQMGKDQCQMRTYGVEFVAKSSEAIKPIYPMHSGEGDPRKTKFCRVPLYEGQLASFTACAKALFGGNSEEIKKGCSFECVRDSSIKVNSLPEGKVGITNANKIEITCDNLTQTHTVNFTQLGAVILKVPCGCHAKVEGYNDQIFPTFPCLKDAFNTSLVTHIVPPHLTNLSDVSLITDLKMLYNTLPGNKTFENLPALYLVPPEEFKLSDAFELRTWKYNSQGSSSMLYIWLTVLTVIVTLLCGFIFLNFGAIKAGGGGFSPVSMLPFLILCPFVVADEDVSQSTWKSTILKIIEALEITNIIFGIVGVVLAVILLVFICKLYKFTRASYRMVRSLVNDVEMNAK